MMSIAAPLQILQIEDAHEILLPLLIVPSVIQILLFFAGLVSVLGSSRHSTGGKILWIALMFFAPFLGPIGWFVMERWARRRSDTR